MSDASTSIHNIRTLPSPLLRLGFMMAIARNLGR
jgi:hypothetical protein